METRTGELYKIANMGGMLEPGRKVVVCYVQHVPRRPRSLMRLSQDIVEPGVSMHPMSGKNIPASADITEDYIIDVLPIVVYITWNAINQKVCSRQTCSADDSFPCRNRRNIRSRKNSGVAKISPDFTSSVSCMNTRHPSGQLSDSKQPLLRRVSDTRYLF